MSYRNPNTEYEKFAQKVYQALVNLDVPKTIDVKHNVKLVGKSGQAHQIDVYWEYEIAEVKHKVAIECKNYKNTVPIGKVRDFYGVLVDLHNVAGIMVTKVGFQKGAKGYASYYGINLKELRKPNKEDEITVETMQNIKTTIRSCLFLIDEEWAKANNQDFSQYRNFLDYISMSSPTGEPSSVWSNATHIPLETIPNAKIYDKKGVVITTFDELKRDLSESSDSERIFYFQNAYVDTRWGKIKIKEVKYTYEKKDQTNVFHFDVKDFIKAVLKDALSGESKFIAK